jgi:thiamine transport system permease protein
MRGARTAAFALVITFFTVFFAFPLFSIVARGLFSADTPVVTLFADLFATERFRRVLWFTVWQATLSTVLTLAVALPGAYVLSRVAFRGRQVLRSLVMVPFVLPTVVVGSAFLAVLGPRTPLNPLLQVVFHDPTFSLDLRRSVTAILIAHVFFNYAVVVRTVGGVWSLLDPRLDDAARTLGAGRLRAFFSVTLPALKAAIASAATIVFLFTFTSFGVILILGGVTRATIEVEIHRATTQLLDLPLAAALSVVQLVAVIATLWVYGRIQRRVVYPAFVSERDVARAPRGALERSFLAANLVVMALLLALPLLVLVERSLQTPSGYGLRHYVAVFTTQPTTALGVSGAKALTNTLMFGVWATLIAVSIGTLTALLAASRQSFAARLLDRSLMVPLGTSAVTLGFGFLLAFRYLPPQLRSSAALIPIVQAVVATPFVVRTVLPVLTGIDKNVRDAARVLGASHRQVTRHIDVPIASRAVLAAAGFAFAIAVGEFGATVFLARAEYPTLPVAIFRLLGRPGVANFGEAMALSVILALMTATAIVLIDRLRLGNIGRF